LHHIQPDHLGTPRKVIQTSNNTAIWDWPILNNAFGEAAPTGTITLNLRFPGQYFDAETGLNYNYFRDYDPATGRYIESDPIGLKGGISTYAYAGGDPLRYIDPSGLDYWVESGLPTEGGGTLHQSVCVGKRGTSNRFCISFGIDKDPGCLMGCNGAVYQDKSGEGTLINSGTSTPKEDADIRHLMLTELGTKGTYFVLGNNCRDYSKAFFKKLERKYTGYTGSH